MTNMTKHDQMTNMNMTKHDHSEILLSMLKIVAMLNSFVELYDTFEIYIFVKIYFTVSFDHFNGVFWKKYTF